MSEIDNTLKANRIQAEQFGSELGRPPSRQLAIITCIDLRLANVWQMLGLGPGDVDIIRNRVRGQWIHVAGDYRARHSQFSGFGSRHGPVSGSKLNSPIPRWSSPWLRAHSCFSA